MGNDVATAIDDRRVALAPEGDRFLGLADVIEAKGRDGGPARRQPLGQEQGRPAGRVGHDVAERGLRTGRHQQPSLDFGRELFAAVVRDLPVDVDAAIGVQETEVSEPDPAGQLDDGGGRCTGTGRLRQEGEYGFAVLRVSVESAGQVLGQQQVFLGDRRHLAVQDGPFDPGPQQQDGNRRDQDESKCQNVA